MIDTLKNSAVLDVGLVRDGGIKRVGGVQRPDTSTDPDPDPFVPGQDYLSADGGQYYITNPFGTQYIAAPS